MHYCNYPSYRTKYKPPILAIKQMEKPNTSNAYQYPQSRVSWWNWLTREEVRRLEHPERFILQLHRALDEQDYANKLLESYEIHIKSHKNLSTTYKHDCNNCDFAFSVEDTLRGWETAHDEMKRIMEDANCLVNTGEDVKARNNVKGIETTEKEDTLAPKTKNKELHPAVKASLRIIRKVVDRDLGNARIRFGNIKKQARKDDELSTHLPESTIELVMHVVKTVEKWSSEQVKDRKSQIEAIINHAVQDREKTLKSDSRQSTDKSRHRGHRTRDALQGTADETRQIAGNDHLSPALGHRRGFTDVVHKTDKSGSYRRKRDGKISISRRSD